MSERKGRVAKHDPDFVRRISQQVLAAYYARNPDELERHLKRDAGYLTKLYDVAVRHDKFVRIVLDALEADGKLPGEFCVEEVTYQVYLAKLLVETSRELLFRHFDEAKTRRYSRAYLDLVGEVLDARERVLANRPVTIVCTGDAIYADAAAAEQEEDGYGL
jgi:hypothetical protein